MGRSGRYKFGKLFDLIFFFIESCPVSLLIRNGFHLVQRHGEQLFAMALQTAAQHGPVVAQLLSALVAQSIQHISVIRRNPAFQAGFRDFKMALQADGMSVDSEHLFSAVQR